MEQGQSGKIVRAAGVVSGATFLSRILGFVRDMIIAGTFGAGSATDAFFAAFRLPNMLRELLGEGALSAAFIPIFAESLAKRGREAAWKLVWTALTILGVLLVLVSVAGIMGAPILIRLIAPGFRAIPPTLELAVLLARTMFPYILFIGLAALFMAILNAQGHFAAPSLSPAILNIAMIGCALVLAPRLDPAILSLAIGVLLGGAGQLLIQIPPAWKRGMSVHRGLNLRDPDLGRIARLMTPGIAGLAVTQVNVFIGTFLASFLNVGSISVLYYAFRLIHLPIGMFGVAIATAAFPTMARQATRQSLQDLWATTAYSLRLVLFMTAPCMVALLVFRVPIVQLLFERGAFDRTLTLATADAVFFYALGLGAYVSTRVLVPAFYSMRDTATPVKIGAVAVVVNIGASLLFMWPLQAGGLALATALSSFVNLGLLLSSLRRRLGRLGGAPFGPWLVRLGAAAIVMVAVGLVMLHLHDPLMVGSLPRRAIALGVELGASLAVFLAVAAWLGLEEGTSLLRRGLPGRASPSTPRSAGDTGE